MWNGIVLSGFADEIASDLDTQMKVIKKLGINHIEMRGVNGKGLVEYTVKEAGEIKQQLDANGISLSSLGSPIGKIKITDAFEPHFELYKHTVELAHLMETPRIRMFSFFMPEQEAPESYHNQVIEQLGHLVDYAKQNEVCLLHENEKDIYGDIASRCMEIMQLYYGSHFQAVFDFANFVQCKQNTFDAYEMLKDYISYVHIKDALWENGDVVPSGMGDGHVPEILKMLKDSGYRGFLSLEPHLSNFAGFQSLEHNTGEKKVLDGEAAFTLAHQSLLDILKTL